MLNSECNGGRQPAGLIAEDGKLRFPTMGGVAVIDPEATKLNPRPSPVMIEAVTLERRQVNFSNGVTIAPGQLHIPRDRGQQRRRLERGRPGVDHHRAAAVLSNVVVSGAVSAGSNRAWGATRFPKSDALSYYLPPLRSLIRKSIRPNFGGIREIGAQKWPIY
jgi:hypothetical protein